MNRTFTCILCPNGCEIRTEYQGTEIRSVSGNKCPKGQSMWNRRLQLLSAI